MHDQPRLEPLENSTFFKDKRASRPLVKGTIARGELSEDLLLTTGRDANGPSASFPFPITAEIMARGKQRYDIYCSPCHSRVGDGRGMIVMRGYKQPASFHDERLRMSPPGYFFNVITNGFATMPSYAMQVEVPDRWAIVAYIRALQLSQNASYDDLNAEERARLTAGEAAEGQGEGGQPAQPAAQQEHHGG
ncbi:MAG TPA: cytochrome c [Candidatus Limnocylindrales bacterium]|nr:cytochrome c [Candidatus Limnocylindrales bacterium]